MEVAAASEDGRSVHSGFSLMQQSERTTLELQRLEDSSKPILEAQRVLREVEREKEDYLQTLKKLKAEREDKIDLIREFQEMQV